MELWIPSERPTRNAVTGSFLPGTVPFNKGKRWDEWMSKNSQERCKKGWKNLIRGRMDIGGWNARPCIAITDDGRWYWFESIKAAGEKTHTQARNINSVCHKKRKRAGGYRWFFEDDPKWREMIWQ